MNLTGSNNLVKIFLLLILLGGCMAKNIIVPEENTVDARAFVENCSSCHSLRHPNLHTAQEWEEVMNLMDMRRKKRGMAKIDEATRSQILAYLKRNAK